MKIDIHLSHKRKSLKFKNETDEIYSQLVRASGCQCQSRNSPGIGNSIFGHNGILVAADEAVLNI